MLTCFALQDIAFAAPTGPAGAAQPMPLPPPMAISQFINDPSRIQMPLEHVSVQEIHAGTNGRLIIHIQDAHANLSGQQSLAKALDQLLTRYDLRLVLVEGSALDSSLDEIRKLAPLKEWSIIARRFLYEGIISGEEYLNLTTEHPMKIVGVEYRDLYDEAVKAYAAIVDRRKDILHYLYQAKVSLERIKARRYPRELREYEARKGPDDGTGAIDFKTGFSSLLKLAESAQYSLQDLPQVARLKVLIEQESFIDFDKANREQTAILEGLNAAGASAEAKEFAEAARRLRFSQVSQFLLIQKLLKTAADREVSIDNFPELMAYAGYLEKFTDLRMEDLMRELEFLEDKVYEKLLPDDDARKARAIDRFLGLLGNAYKLQMSSHDYGMFTFNEGDFKTEQWLAFMNRQLVDLGFFESLVPYQPYLEEARADFGRFYQLVGERDLAFMENANRIMTEQRENAAVLIAGGYHTAHLTELLRKEGTSYIVLTPVVTDTTDHARYEELLLSHLKEQEKRLSSSRSSAKDSGAYRAQNVATTKIPRGLRRSSFASRMAGLRALEPEAGGVVDARLPGEAIEAINGAAARMADLPESVRPNAVTDAPSEWNEAYQTALTVQASMRGLTGAIKRWRHLGFLRKKFTQALVRAVASSGGRYVESDTGVTYVRLGQVLRSVPRNSEVWKKLIALAADHLDKAQEQSIRLIIENGDLPELDDLLVRPDMLFEALIGRRSGDVVQLSLRVRRIKIEDQALAQLGTASFDEVFSDMVDQADQERAAQRNALGAELIEIMDEKGWDPRDASKVLGSGWTPALKSGVAAQQRVWNLLGKGVALSVQPAETEAFAETADTQGIKSFLGEWVRRLKEGVYPILSAAGRVGLLRVAPDAWYGRDKDESVESWTKRIAEPFRRVAEFIAGGPFLAPASETGQVRPMVKLVYHLTDLRTSESVHQAFLKGMSAVEPSESGSEILLIVPDDEADEAALAEFAKRYPGATPVTVRQVAQKVEEAPAQTFYGLVMSPGRIADFHLNIARLPDESKAQVVQVPVDRPESAGEAMDLPRATLAVTALAHKVAEIRSGRVADPSKIPALTGLALKTRDGLRTLFGGVSGEDFGLFFESLPEDAGAEAADSFADRLQKVTFRAGTLTRILETLSAAARMAATSA